MFFQNYGDYAKAGQTSLDVALGSASDFTKSWQSIAMEVTDYSKRSIELNTALVEKLMGARSLEQALEIQTSHARRVYDDYVQQVNRLNGLMADLTKQALKPVERSFAP
jgi:hypothetical protein